jgi:hypothetical protein
MLCFVVQFAPLPTGDSRKCADVICYGLNWSLRLPVQKKKLNALGFACFIKLVVNMYNRTAQVRYALRACDFRCPNMAQARSAYCDRATEPCRVRNIVPKLHCNSSKLITIFGGCSLLTNALINGNEVRRKPPEKNWRHRRKFCVEKDGQDMNQLLPSYRGLFTATSKY